MPDCSPAVAAAADPKAKALAAKKAVQKGELKKKTLKKRFSTTFHRRGGARVRPGSGSPFRGLLGRVEAVSLGGGVGAGWPASVDAGRCDATGQRPLFGRGIRSTRG